MNENQIPEDILRRMRELAAEQAPAPTEAMTAFLADPASSLTDKGALAAMSGSNVHGSATRQTAGLPKEKRGMGKDKLMGIRGLLARLGLAGRVALVTAVIAAAGMGTAAAATAVNFVTEDPPASVDTESDVQDDPADDVDDSTVGDDQGDDSQGDANQGDDNQGDSDDQGDDNQADSDDQGDGSTGGSDDQGDDNQGDSDDQGDDNQGDGSSGGSDHQGDDNSGSDDQSDDSGDNSGDDSGQDSGGDDSGDDGSGGSQND